MARYVDPQTTYTAKNAKMRVPERDLESVCMCSTLTLRGKRFRFYPHSLITPKTQKVIALRVHSKNHIGDSLATVRSLLTTRIHQPGTKTMCLKIGHFHRFPQVDASPR